MSYAVVIGLEVHIELATHSKMFCGCPADHFGKQPNTQTCPVCLGLPGALPVPNAKAIEWCIKLGLALGCRINLESKFDRKNYFYPDLPKGYQISQYDQPFCYNGEIQLSSGTVIHLTRVHLEEDTAKLQHATIDGAKVSLIDFNRSGVPLVEIVTEPDLHQMADALEFLKEIQAIVRALGISTADMEKGSMRLEANISLRPEGQTSLPPYKVEVKNVNSFRFIRKAVEHEILRQTRILESGKIPDQETRGYNENTGETFLQRAKESAHDYRYFPEPDIPPFKFSPTQITKWKKDLPQLPSTQRKKLIDNFGISSNNAYILVANSNMYNLFIQTATKDKSQSKKIADFLINKRYGQKLPTSSEELIHLLQVPQATTDQSQIEAEVKQVLALHVQAVTDIKKGKEQALFFLVGQVKKKLPQVDVSLVKKILTRELSQVDC